MKKDNLAKLVLCAAAALLPGLGPNAHAQSAPAKTDPQNVGYAFGLEIGSLLKKQAIEVEPDFVGKGISTILAYGTPWLTSAQVSNVLVTLPLAPKEVVGGDKYFKNTKEEVGYALGLYFGRNVRSHEPRTDVPSLVAAIKDTLSGAKLAMTTNEEHAIFDAEQARQTAELKKQGEANATDGPAFLEKNKSTPGITVLTNGLQYQILTKGAGAIPDRYDKVSVNYRGSLMSGELFDASDPGETVTFPLTRVIKGWNQILEMMPTGSKWKVFIPADLAYGAKIRPPLIAPNSPLIFDIELVKIEPPDANETFLQKNSTQPGVKVLDDGLQYKVITQGTGAKPMLADTVEANYRGTLIDGTEFDASAAGKPASFNVSGVIPGWTEILQLMPVGSKWQVTIPDYLGYGERGFPPKIKPNALLIFDIELVSIRKP